MRSLLFLLLLLPVFGSAQINRSARELASERIQEYVVNKLFKDKEYKAVSYGELKALDNPRSTIVWTLSHKFEIANGSAAGSEKNDKIFKQHKFLFYLNGKMEVVRAETFYEG